MSSECGCASIGDDADGGSCFCDLLGEEIEFLFGKGHEEGFQHDGCFAEAGGQIVMDTIESGPIEARGDGGVLDNASDRCAIDGGKRVCHVVKGAQLVEETIVLAPQNLGEDFIAAGGLARGIAAEIISFQ